MVSSLISSSCRKRIRRRIRDVTGPQEISIRFTKLLFIPYYQSTNDDVSPFDEFPILGRSAIRYEAIRTSTDLT